MQKRFGTPNRAGTSYPKARSIAFSGRCKSYPKARSIASSGRSSLPFARRSQPTGTPRPHQWLLMGVQACRLPAPKRLKRLKRLKPLKAQAQAIPMPDPLLFLGGARATPMPDPSLLLGGPAAFAANRHPKATSMVSFGRPSLPLKLAKAFRNAQPRRHKLSPSAVQPVVRQAFAANRHPKATSMASYGRPSLPFASP